MFWKKPAPGMRPQWMIVGLGNPGGEYKGTRHNVGFDAVDRLAEKHKIRMNKAKHRALTGEGEIDGIPVLLVRPLTFMNLSGQSVGPLARDNEIPPAHILVITDDLDLKVGVLRLRDNGSAGGHNGHKSLIQHLKTQDYPRIKIGIGKGEDSTIDHVLSAFKGDERDTIKGAIDAAAETARRVVSSGWQEGLEAVDRWNKRSN